MTVQKSTSHNLDKVVAPNSRMKGRQNCTIATRAAVLNVDMSPATDAGTFAGSACTLHDWQQIASSRSVKRQGRPRSSVQVWYGWWCSRPRCGLFKDSSLSGDATWAFPVSAAISGVDAGMWYREVGSLGAKR